MEDTLKRCLKSAIRACTSSAFLDSSSYSTVLKQLLSAYSHAMRLVNRQSEEQAASDALLLTAQAVKDMGMAAVVFVATASNAQTARRQQVVTCVGESGVSHYSSMSIASCGCSSHSHVAGCWPPSSPEWAMKRLKPLKPHSPAVAQHADMFLT
jgi:hypothetical protein